jgi:hypothetical protein
MTIINTKNRNSSTADEHVWARAQGLIECPTPFFSPPILPTPAACDAARCVEAIPDQR